MTTSESHAKRILVAVDESEESAYALNWTLQNIIKPGDHLHVLHAQPPPKIYAGPAGPGFYVSPETIDVIRKHEEKVSREVVKKARGICQQAGVQAEGDVIIGEPREAICEAVDQLKANLLVMGSHGYGAIKRAFLGSVSDYCVHHASCPVIVVRKSGTTTH
eukprot:TRINITY_DN393_c0_g1_i1.p1 TRINITY_DN393_c0_g1~~TRINITY_DN393_c0_g1_i1.p1  ORF type:complete len:162 (+),score=27.76 TRINITY_DN393_c0_g1_i1:137-622(+)